MKPMGNPGLIGAFLSKDSMLWTGVHPPSQTREPGTMKLCPKCNHSPWPFVMVLAIAGVIAFITWLILGLSVRDQLPRLAAAGLVFLAVGGTLLHYVLTCLKRHCRHDEERLPQARRPAVHHHG
jgi:hypothetical protein